MDEGEYLSVEGVGAYIHMLALPALHMRACKSYPITIFSLWLVMAILAAGRGSARSVVRDIGYAEFPGA